MPVETDPAAASFSDDPFAALSDAPGSVPLVMPDLLVATCGPDGAYVHANPAWSAVLGDGALWARLDPEDARSAAAYLADAARGLLVTHQVFLVERPEGDLPLPVLLHFLPVRLPGAPPGQLPVVVSGEVLQEPASWAADQTRRRRTEMLGQMAMGVAHDFNNLLTTILGHVELLHTTLGDAPEEVRAQLATVERAASDGATLVRKIQQYIRHEKRERFEPVELPALINEVLSLTRPYWHNEPRRQGIAIWVDAELDPVPAIQGFPTELREVFVNLILNAVQAMPAGGTLRVRTRTDPARGAVVEVEDTGIGMSEHVRQRIFEPLFTTKGEKGTGMGLTMASGIVQGHHGAIEVESAPGQGSTFRLVFPPSDATFADDEGAPPPAAPPRRPARRLVVDDEPMVRTVTSKLLRLKGHEVTEADSGFVALVALAAGDPPPFDLVVTDLSMPEMSGRELAQAVRARYGALPVLLLTGDTDAEAESSEVDAVVKKPFKLDVLEAEIQRLLAGPR
jgi:signal transduction histidine kinase